MVLPSSANTLPWARVVSLATSGKHTREQRDALLLVVVGLLGEVLVAQRFIRCDSLGRIVREHAPQQVQPSHGERRKGAAKLLLKPADRKGSESLAATAMSGGGSTTRKCAHSDACHVRIRS